MSKKKISTEIWQHFLPFSGGWIYLYDINTIGYIISVLGYFKMILNKSPKDEIPFHGGLDTSTKCSIFPKRKTYLAKAKHSSFYFAILTNLIVAK